jgi:hypothetical protein
MSRARLGLLAFAGVAFVSLAVACRPGAPVEPVGPLTQTPPLPLTALSPTQTPTLRPPTPGAPPPTPDLGHQPLYWFAPLPRQRPPAYHGSLDYLDLFEPEADWDAAASGLQVFKFYGGWAAGDSTDSELRRAIAAVRARGLAVAVELGPLVATDQCGQSVEGFAGEQGVYTVRRIESVGGTVDLIALDEPYFYGHLYDGEQACQWPAEDIARGVGAFIQQVRAVFPDVVVGDIEPLTGPGTAAAYRDWLATFKAVNGYDLAFLHLDVDWSNSTWPEQVLAMEGYGRAADVPIGLIYNGNSQDATDEAWLSIAGERVKRYELEAGGQPDHIVFQSWHDRPDAVLPETDPYTFTGFVRRYFEDKSSLGYSPEARSANLAFQKAVRVSGALPGYGGELAVDGDAGTVWNAGDDAPQWIEIDLGAAYDVAEIRLAINQYPAGATVHRVLAQGPGTGDAFVLLHEFAGATADSEVLAFAPPEPWTGIQFIRVETRVSPSWVSWREIEVVAAP